MRTLIGKRFSNRGVSVIIAALLLIAIAVAAAVLLYVFSIGLMGSLSSSGGSQTKDQLIMAAYNWANANPPTQLTLYVQNVGSSSLTLTTAGGASYFINGVLITTVTTTCASPLAPGSAACPVVLTDPTGTGAPTFTSGAAYPVKVVTPDGGVFSYSAIYGQSS